MLFGKTGSLLALRDELVGRSKRRADLMVETGSYAILTEDEDDLVALKNSWMTSDFQFASMMTHFVEDVRELSLLWMVRIDGSLDGLANISISAMAMTRSFFPSLMATY